MNALDDIETPPSATGLYPGPVWGTPPVVGNAFSDDDNPPSATGLYPGPVWGTPPFVANAFDDASAGATSPAPAKAIAPTTDVELDMQEMYRIIRASAAGISGDDGYSAISSDRGESTGLVFGLAHFRQSTGELGRVLAKMRERDAALFAQIFGADSDALIATTNAQTQQERLAPVGGMPLWSATWIDRFRLAGALPECQAAQNEIAIEHQLRPVLPVAFAHGLVSDRALAVVYDFAATLGTDNAMLAVIQSIGPMPGTPADLIARIVENSSGAQRRRLERLQQSSELHDITYRRP